MTNTELLTLAQQRFDASGCALEGEPVYDHQVYICEQCGIALVIKSPQPRPRAVLSDAMRLRKWEHEQVFHASTV